MFSITVLGRGAERYYFSTVAGSSDLPEGLIEEDPRYLGSGARAIGLTGRAELSEVSALFERVHPRTGEELGRLPPATVAYDLTFSDPKSVSLAQALAPPDLAAGIGAAHDRAVREVLAFIETDLLAARKTAARVAHLEKTEGAVAVAFRHGVSRAGDPHLHTHLLVLSSGRTHGGEWRSIDGRSLYGSQRLLRALYDCHLRAELGQLGLRFAAGRRGTFDLAGISRLVVGEFSRQGRRIEEALAKAGPLLPREQSLLRETLRPPKDRSRPYSSLRAEWRERAHEVGLSRSLLEEALGQSDDGRRPGVRELGSWWERARPDIDATTSRSELLVARAENDPSGATLETVLADVEQTVSLGLVERRGERYLVPGAADRLRRSGEHFAAAASGLDQQVLSYAPGERLAALDRLSALATRDRLLALTPGKRYAISFSAATGIESLAAARSDEVPSREADWIALPECWALSPAELEAALAVARNLHAGLVFFSREDRLSSSLQLAHLGEVGFDLELPTPAATEAVLGEPDEGSHQAVAAPSAACRRAAELARAASDRGDRAVVLVPDLSMRVELRRLTRELRPGVSVLLANRVPAGASGPVVSIGPASGLGGRPFHSVLVRPELARQERELSMRRTGQGRALEPGRRTHEKSRGLWR